MDRRKATSSVTFATAGGPSQSVSPLRCDHRGPEDDFFCLRYQIWYPSVDCAIRTKFRTSPGCSSCEQGRFNLQRHKGRIARTRFTVTRTGLE